MKIEGKAFVHPTAVLFNGGVFKAEGLKQRVLDVLNRWPAADRGAAVKELEGAELDGFVDPAIEVLEELLHLEHERVERHPDCVSRRARACRERRPAGWLGRAARAECRSGTRSPAG